MIDLQTLVARLARRQPGRSEANVQSDLHLLLTVAPLDLGDEDLQEIVLESPAGQRRRIDVEVGLTVFEVKRDLRVGTVRAEAVEQLAGYVADRTATMAQRYVGVLTDGAEWHLYHLVDGALVPASSLAVDPSAVDVEGLCVWLEGVLATAERIVPTPREIERRLGAASPAHALDSLELSALYRAHRDRPTVKLKRELWAKLLTTALGTNFADEDCLFVEHTLLVATAEIIGHAVVGFDPADPSVAPAAIASGALFDRAQIGGVVEADFFDWVVEVPGGDRFFKTLARRLARFAWDHVEHDVMKVLYESVIQADVRHRLGEYYTPDWLADEIVEACVTDPLAQRVLDPACGSGTFLFHAVRRYLAAADAARLPNTEAINGVTARVIGVDVHPVAVTLARVTYLLAIGMARLQTESRPAFTVPVYLGDSVQWGQERNLFTAEMLNVPAEEDGAKRFAAQLRFPDHLLADAGGFDRLVSELAEKAAYRTPGSEPPSMAPTFRRFCVHAEDQATLAATFQIMCALHDQGRDHIWGYYVRNLARPVWLARPDNRVDVLVGNPPWLSYRHMTEDMQAAFRAMSVERGLWAGGSAATHQDLSGLFLARCVEQYLRPGGRFGLVMPLAALSRLQFVGLRTGRYPTATATEHTHVAFGKPWDLHKVKPSFFPVPACVLFGERTAEGTTPLGDRVEVWAGRVPVRNASKAAAAPHLTRTVAIRPTSVTTEASPYHFRFVQGATVVPRLLLVVEPSPPQPLGTGAGRRAVQSRRGANEKPPWKHLLPLDGVVDIQFVCPLHVGATILPFRPLEPWLAVIPWDGKRLLDSADEHLDLYPGLADWWRRAEAIWVAHRSSDRLTLKERLDFRHGLSDQLPAAPHRVVYSGTGMYLAAATISDPRVVIGHTLYWAAAWRLDEARYLTAVLNSATLTERVRPLQARGEHNPRHFDKYVFRVPIPLFDSANAAHCRLVELAAQAERVAAAVELPSGRSFQSLRRRVRQALEADGVGLAIDAAVSSLLDPDD